MASLFFDFKCHGGSSAATTAVSWCKTEHLLAVATEDGELNFFQDEVPLLCFACIDYHWFRVYYMISM
jgi:hypothetical protein